MHPVLIFGATGGIGSALARRLTTAGVAVHLTARDPGRLAALAEGLQVPFTAGDVRVGADLQRIVTEAVAATGALAGLVFAVGSIDLTPLRRAEPDRYAEAFELNVTAAAQAVRHAATALAAGQGAVVLFSSVAARTGFRSHAVIGSAKAAVEGLTVALAAELAPKVRVNCVAPTLTRTPLTATLTANAAMVEQIERQHPMARLGAAEDVAAAAAYFLSPDAGFLTGQILAVDGGRGALAT